MKSLVRLAIMPHVGIGPVPFGMTHVQFDAVLSSVPGVTPGRPKGGPSATIMCYFCVSLQIEFDPEGTVSFIEVCFNPGALCTYKGLDVFDLPASELFAIFAVDDASGPHTFTASEYLFPEVIVALGEVAEQYDRKGNENGPVYATVGVGYERCLVAPSKILGGLKAETNYA